MTEKHRFDFARLPFSRFGSWMVMGQRSGNRLILKNVHNQGEQLFLLTPMVDGRAVDYAITMTAASLVLTAAEGTIEFCFESSDTLRARGTGVGLDLLSTTRAVAYSESPAYATLNFRSALRRYQLETLAGTSALP